MTVLGSLLSGCNAKTRGCLDIEAENFEFEAERADASMCEYPDLILEVSYVWGDSIYSPDSFYLNSMGQPVKILGFHLLLSAFAVERAGDNTLKPVDTTLWYLGSAGTGQFLPATDDFIFVDRSRFSYTIGEIRESGMMTSYRFNTAVADTLTPTVPDSISDGSRIQDPRALYDDDLGQFASARFIITQEPDTATIDTLIVYGGPKQYNFDFVKDLLVGEDDVLRVKLDLAAAFRNTDLSGDPAAIVQQIANNLIDVISDNN